MSVELEVLEDIKSKIHTVRGVQVIFDRDLAELYGVETRVLNQAVKRNPDRFPERFAFQLNKEELENYRAFLMKNRASQNVISNYEKMGLRRLPFVFTEQGVAMLSSVLRSEKAIKVNIKIMDAFIAMRKFLKENYELFSKLEFVESKVLEHDNKIAMIFNILEKETLPKKGIFFNGEIVDAHIFISNLIKKAKNRIILIDNYVSDETLIILSKKKPGVKMLIYTKNTSKSLKQDVKKFNEQHKNLEIKEFNKSHDRFLIVDEEIYHIGASIKDLGKKWFAFSRLKFDVDVILSRLK